MMHFSRLSQETPIINKDVFFLTFSLFHCPHTKSVSRWQDEDMNAENLHVLGWVFFVVVVVVLGGEG